MKWDPGITNFSSQDWEFNPGIAITTAYQAGCKTQLSPCWCGPYLILPYLTLPSWWAICLVQRPLWWAQCVSQMCHVTKTVY